MAFHPGIYAKSAGTLVVVGLTATISALADNNITANEWITIVVATLASATAVWAVPQTPEKIRVWGKLSVGVVTAFLSSIAVGLNDGPGGSIAISQAELLTAIVAAFTAAGVVGLTSNAAASDPVDAHKRVVPVSLAQKQELVNAHGADYSD